MSYRRLVFGNGQFYHIFNRTVGSIGVFSNKNNFQRAFSLIDFPFTSFTSYAGKNSIPFINKKVIMASFKKIDAYKTFVYNQADYQRRLQDIKHLTLEQ